MPVAQVPRAFLRVWVPLAALPEAERTRCAALLAGQAGALSPLDTAHREHERAVIAAIRERLTAGPEQVLVEVVDGVRHVCQIGTALRTYESVAAARSGLPPAAADLLVPRRLAVAAETARTALRRARPGAAVQVRTASFGVPAAWFLPFVAEDREVGDGLLRYRAPLAQAQRRIAAALRVLLASIPAAPVVTLIAALGAWLQELPARGLLELDYGDLAVDRSVTELEADTTLADLTESLACLARSDAVGAARAYERVLERWRDRQQRDTAS